MGLVDHVACIGAMKSACKTLARKLEEKKPFGKYSYGYGDWIK
jgi:hypothetical protein